MARKKAETRSKKKPASNKGAIDLPPDLRSDDFKPVAEMVAPNPPEWLAEYLHEWAPMFFLDQAVGLRQPTRAQMVKILKKVRDAAALLRRALAESSVCEFLNAGGDRPMDAPFKFQMIVGELQVRADRASKLPVLVDHKGKVKPGAGRAQLGEAIPARIYCAIFIAEAWKWFRGRYPGPRNRRAAQAIDLYWKLAGGRRDRRWGGDPLGAWRSNFEDAAKTPTDKYRAEFRRHMGQHAQFAEMQKLGTEPDDGK
ncbi:MAG TPA: hypothetical protein VG889_14065 [Rhizomicrobium sp.]|nr:hypothetical protein [Rhizomicrobium sp.]